MGNGMIAGIFAPLWTRIFAGLSALLLIGFITQTIRIEGFWLIVGFKEENAILRIDLSKARAATEAEIAKHEATKKAYRDAQAEAERMEAERLARITAQQERINNDRLAAYSSRLSAARAAADRLRAQAGARAGAVGAPGCQQVPDDGHSAGAADPACDRGFLIEERLIATKQAIQLDELITAVEQHRAVPMN